MLIVVYVVIDNIIVKNNKYEILIVLKEKFLFFKIIK